jgi:hypothetical protein
MNHGAHPTPLLPLCQLQKFACISYILCLPLHHFPPAGQARPIFPFTAVIGQEEMKLALIPLRFPLLQLQLS